MKIALPRRCAIVFASCVAIVGCSKPQMMQLKVHFVNGFVVDSGASVVFGNRAIGYVKDVKVDANTGDFVVELEVRTDVPLWDTDYVFYESPVPNHPGKFVIMRDAKVPNAGALLQDGSRIDGVYAAPGMANPREVR